LEAFDVKTTEIVKLLVCSAIAITGLWFVIAFSYFLLHPFGLSSGIALVVASVCVGFSLRSASKSLRILRSL